MNRELLEKRFPAEQIKQRQGDHGEVLDYLEGAIVIQRLNEAFNAEWSFEVIEHLIQEKEVLVSGKLTAQGITKTQYGNKKREESVGDDLKAATTDCIKKCATLFGIGLHLYFDEKTIAALQPPPYGPTASFTRPAAATPPPPPPPSNGNNGYGDHTEDAGRLTAKQLSAIFGVAKSLGWSSKETREYTKERFGKVPDYLSKKEASTLIDRLKGGGR